MGRYKKDYSSEYCSEPLRLRLTPSLLAQLDAASSQFGVCRSSFVREMLRRQFSGTAPATVRLSQASPEVNALTESLEGVQKEHKSVGVLINQGMRRFHATGKMDVVPGLTRAYDRYLSVTQLELAALEHLLRL